MNTDKHSASGYDCSFCFVRTEMETDGQKNWKQTLGVVWIAQAASFAGFSFAFPFLPFYLRELGVETDAAVSVWTGVLNSSPAITMVVFAPLWGMLSDRYGRRIMVERSMFGASLALAMMSVVQGPWQILAIRIMQGALSGTISASTTLVASVVPAKRAGFTLGLLQTASFVGMCLGPLTGGFAAELIGYRHCFIVAAAMLAIGGVLVLLFAKEEAVPSTAQAGSDVSRGPGIRTMLLSGSFLAILAATTFMYMARNAVGAIFPLYVETILQPSDLARAPSATGMMLGLTGAAAAGSALLFGWMCDRFGSAKILGAAVFIEGSFLSLHFLAMDFASLSLLRMGAGASTGATGPAINSMIHKMVPRASHGKAFGLSQSATSLGFGIGPSLGGLLGAWVGFRLPFLLLGFVQLALGTLLFARLKAVVHEQRNGQDCTAGRL